MSTELQPFEVTDANFSDTVIAPSHAAPVLVDFWAEWCQPCKQLSPILGKLLTEYQGAFLLGMVNIEEQRQLAAEAGVRSVPMVLVFRKGMVADQFFGLQPENALRQVIERNLFRASDRLMSEALKAEAAGELDRAVGLAEQALEQDPEHAEHQYQLARLLVSRADTERAATLLENLPREMRESQAVHALRGRIELVRELADAPDRATLEGALASGGDDLSARYQLAGRCMQDGDFAAALDHLIKILQADRDFRGSAARDVMLGIFAQLGDDHPLVHRYRSVLFNTMH